MERVFISYHHKREQRIKEELLNLDQRYQLFVDCSVTTGDIDERLAPQEIRQKIRQEYLSESTVLLLIVGRETRYRKHVDWELYSSMYNGSTFGRSGVVVILAPDCQSDFYTAPFDRVKESLYPGTTSWKSIESREEFESRYEHLPSRIIDNLLMPKSLISVINWSKIQENPMHLRLLIGCVHDARGEIEYDMSREMRMRDHNLGVFV